MVILLFWLLTVFSYLWSDKKKYPKSPLSKPLLCQQILNLASSNIHISLLEINGN